MQLDIFEHSRDVMLTNDVVQALERGDLAAALQCRAALALVYPDAAKLPDLDQLIAALARPLSTIADHHDLNQARQWLSATVAPSAWRVLGTSAGQAWLVPLWKALAIGSSKLPFRNDCPEEHSATIWLHIAEWDQVVAAVQTIESWRKKPVPLAWMLRANLALSGLQANLGLLAELAWMSPRQLGAVVTSARDALLSRLVKKFEAEFEGFEGPADLAWLPAWALADQPSLAPAFALAQPGQHSAPERGMRLMVELLGLEHQGRHHDIVGKRKNLRDLNAALFAAYMKSR